MVGDKNKNGNKSLKEVPVEVKIQKGKSIIDDTFRNEDGKWSRKSITCFISFGYSIIYSMTGLIMSKDVEEFVVLGFLSLSAGLLGLSSWEKKNL